MARILVTGGAGFVGSHLCERLIQLGHEVVAIDDLSTGSRDNVAGLEGSGRFRLIEHDVREPYDLEIDAVYNLACPASPPRYQADPVKTTMTSILGTLHALELAARRRARFLQASTSEVYGDPEVHPQPESYSGSVNPIGIRACYDEGKRCAESLVMDFHRVAHVSTRIARVFNTYGPKMAFEDGRVISNFVIQALLGRDLTIYGDGRQTRSFCFVDDLISGLIELMETDESFPVNLGNPDEFTIQDLAKILLELVPTAKRMVHRPLPADDPRQRRPDIGRAKQLFGFSPMVPLRDGLVLTIRDFRQRLSRAEISKAGH
jgi:UDP-glucuronate decarboxylase